MIPIIQAIYWLDLQQNVITTLYEGYSIPILAGGQKMIGFMGVEASLSWFIKPQIYRLAPFSIDEMLLETGVS